MQAVETTQDSATAEADNASEGPGSLLWIILGATFVVLAGATTLAVVMRKRKKN